MYRPPSPFPRLHVLFAASAFLAAWLGVVSDIFATTPNHAHTHPLTAFFVTVICLDLVSRRNAAPSRGPMRGLFWLAGILAVGQIASHVFLSQGVVSGAITGILDGMVEFQGATGFDSAVLSVLFLFGLSFFDRHSFWLLFASLTALLVLMISAMGTVLSIEFCGDQISIFTFFAFVSVLFSVLSILSRKLPLRVLLSDSRPGREVRFLLGGTVVAAIILVFATIAVAELHMIDDRYLAMVFSALISIAIFNMMQVVALGSRGLIAEAKERRMRRHIEYERDHDYLTGLLTRRAGRKRALAALSERDSPEKTLGVIIYDLDDFKAVNDAFGHDAGDKTLQAFARELKRVSTKDDILIRWGGDEFVVIRPVEDPVAFLNEHRKAVCPRQNALASGEIAALQPAPAHSVGVSVVFENETDLRPAILRADASLLRKKQAPGPRLAEKRYKADFAFSSSA